MTTTFVMTSRADKMKYAGKFYIAKDVLIIQFDVHYVHKSTDIQYCTIKKF